MTDPTSDPGAHRRERMVAARGNVSDSLSSLWWTFLVRGVLALALGVAALFWPTGSVSVLLRIAGVVLVLDGAMVFFGMRRQAGQGAEGASGVVSAVIGLVLVAFPSGSARFAFVLLGLWALFTGAGYLLTWWRMPEDDPERGSAGGVGAVALLLGLALIFWPGTGLVAVGWMIAIVALIIAALMFFLASRFRRLNARLTSPS